MQSETIGAIAAALAKAQGQIKPAPMDRENPFFKSKYATLTSLWESARVALATNGLAVTQATDLDEAGHVVLVTTLMHSSGEWIGSVYPVEPADRKPQTLGSALTYARRYAFGSLVGLSSEDDDDGNAASNGASNAPQRKEATPQHRTPPAATSATTTSAPAAGKAPNGNGDAMSPAMKAFHKAGNSLYGDNWDAKRHEIVKAATKGRTQSSKELTANELTFLLEGLGKRLEEQFDAAVQDAPELNPDALTVPE